jgi:hypothetical protein
MSETPRTDELAAAMHEQNVPVRERFRRMRLAASTLERELVAVTRERETAVEDAYARGLQEGRIDLTKIVRKWDSECLDPPEVEGLRDYAMLDGERLETLWRAFELAMAREMETARERDEAKNRFINVALDMSMAHAERDALSAEVETLREKLRASDKAHDDLIRRVQWDTGL